MAKMETACKCQNNVIIKYFMVRLYADRVKFYCEDGINWGFKLYMLIKT